MKKNFGIKLDEYIKWTLNNQSPGTRLLFDNKTYEELCVLENNEILLLVDNYIANVDLVSYESWLSVLPTLLDCYFDIADIAGFQFVTVLEKVYRESNNYSFQELIFSAVQEWLCAVTDEYIIKDGYYLACESSFKSVVIELLISKYYHDVVANFLKKKKDSTSRNSTIWFCSFFEELADVPELYFDTKRHYRKGIWPIVESYCVGKNKLYFNKHVEMLTIACENDEIPQDYCNRILAAMKRLPGLIKLAQA